MEQFFEHNPAVAVWIVGTVGTLAGILVAYIVRLGLSKILAVLAEQNDELSGLKLSLSEIRADHKMELASIKARLYSLEFHAWGKKPEQLD